MTTTAAPATYAPKPKVLLVDDEPALLDGLRRQLRTTYAVTTAPDGPTALQILDDQPDFAVVISDMRMPQMDGAELLARVRQLRPDTVRMLLTGQADIDAAVAAINNGQVFRFLTKPCTPEVLQGCLRDAVRLHELTCAERDLLDKTLRGSVQALVDTLALAQPQAFARAQRITQTVADIADQLGITDRWEIDLAAMLSQIGAVSLPASVLDKLDRGMPLSEEERGMVSRVPQLSAQLLAGIPRLEQLTAAIATLGAPLCPPATVHDPDVGATVANIADALRVAIDFDYLTGGKIPPLTAIAKMRTRPYGYPQPVLDALVVAHSEDSEADAPVEKTVNELVPGMIVAMDITTERGILLVGRGTVVSEAMIRRLHNHSETEGVAARVLVFDARI